jgi:thiosulfate dehydrogenase (quinone) large subunit
VGHRLCGACLEACIREQASFFSLFTGLCAPIFKKLFSWINIGRGITMVPQKQPARPAAFWALLPLRLFLGITFVYAGIQKFTDPQFFHSDTAGYIGKQLVAYANGSPLHNFLLQIVVPHALLFGFLVAYGEIAIGLGTLFGVLLRPAALFGMLISFTFYLSVSWHVYPYFYGADIVFVFGWLTMLLNGPIQTGLPTFDELLAFSLVNLAEPQQQARRAQQLAFLLGVPAALSLPGTNNQPMKQRYTVQRATATRRSFLFGVLGGGVGILAFLGSFYAVSRRLQPETAHPAAGNNSTGPVASTPVAGGTTPAASSGVIAQVSAVARNSAVVFTLPKNGDPGVLIHTQDDKFVAFDATCTHAGCQVDYDPSLQLLVCPCHGAEFDPKQAAAVVQGPAPTPLTAVAIQIESTTGAITLK